jgi:uncharacterized protein (DUF486 family)
LKAKGLLEFAPSYFTNGTVLKKSLISELLTVVIFVPMNDWFFKRLLQLRNFLSALLNLLEGLSSGE